MLVQKVLNIASFLTSLLILQRRTSSFLRGVPIGPSDLPSFLKERDSSPYLRTLSWQAEGGIPSTLALAVQFASCERCPMKFHLWLEAEVWKDGYGSGGGISWPSYRFSLVS